MQTLLEKKKDQDIKRAEQKIWMHIEEKGVKSLVAWNDHRGKRKEGSKIWSKSESTTMYNFIVSLFPSVLQFLSYSCFSHLNHSPAKKGKVKAELWIQGNPEPSYSLVMHEGFSLKSI